MSPFLLLVGVWWKMNYTIWAWRTRILNGYNSCQAIPRAGEHGKQHRSTRHSVSQRVSPAFYKWSTFIMSPPCRHFLWRTDHLQMAIYNQATTKPKNMRQSPTESPSRTENYFFGFDEARTEPWMQLIKLQIRLVMGMTDKLANPMSRRWIANELWWPHQQQRLLAGLPWNGNWGFVAKTDTFMWEVS